MTDSASAYVSRRLTEDVLERSVRALPSLRTSLTDDDVRRTIEAHVKGLRDFTFRAGLDLRTLQEDLKDAIPTRKRLTRDGLDSGYTAARESLGDAFEITLNDIAAGIASSALRIVDRIRSELPKEVDALRDRIQERTESGSVDGSEPLEPATAFTWGRLADPVFLSTVQDICTERDRTWSRKKLEARAAERLAALALAIPLPICKDETVLSALEETMVQNDHKDAYAVMTEAKAFRKLVNGLEIVTNLENRSGLYHLASYVSFLDTVMAGIDYAEKVIPEIEGNTDSLEKRIDALKTRILLSYGACQVLRETVFSRSFIIPIPHDTKAMLPKGSDLLFNADLREDCEIETPEMAVTEVYAYYHGNGIRVGPNGMTLETYAKIKEKVSGSLESRAHVTEKDVRRKNVHVFQTALDEVLREEVLTPCLNQEGRNMHALIRDHNAAVARIRFNMAHDADIRDELLDYKVRMDGNEPVSTFRTSLVKAIDSNMEENDDRRRDISYIQAFSSFVTNFLTSADLMQAA